MESADGVCAGETRCVWCRAEGISQPVNLEDAKVLCGLHEDAAYLPEIIRALVATAIGFAALTLICAVFLHVGHPSRSQIHYLGLVPGLALLVAGTICFSCILVIFLFLFSLLLVN